MRRALVCGAGGFIGGHLVKKLKREGYWVRGVDIKHHEFAPTQADEFLLLDLRDPENCRKALTLPDGTFDEVYQLAADMGGMGFISVAECEVLRNNALINIHMAHTAAEMGVARYFFSSSVCVYRDMEPDEPPLTEDDAIPANPDNEYRREKLYAERVAMVYGCRYPMKVRNSRRSRCDGSSLQGVGPRQGCQLRRSGGVCLEKNSVKKGPMVGLPSVRTAGYSTMPAAEESCGQPLAGMSLLQRDSVQRAYMGLPSPWPLPGLASLSSALLWASPRSRPSALASRIFAMSCRINSPYS